MSCYLFRDRKHVYGIHNALSSSDVCLKAPEPKPTACPYFPQDIPRSSPTPPLWATSPRVKCRVSEGGEGTPLALLMLALPRMLQLCKSKASAIKTSATRRKHPFSIRHIGKAANSHSICQCGVSNLRPCAMPTDLPSSLSAASQLSCMETQAVGPPWSPCPPGTCCTPQPRLTAAAQGLLSEVRNLSAKKHSGSDFSKQQLRLPGNGLLIQWSLTYIW